MFLPYRRFPLAWSCAALLLLAGCVTDKVTGKKRFSVRNWTAEDELSYGKQAAPNIESEFDAAYTDKEATDYLDDLIDELVEHSPRQREVDWNFKILNTSKKNAFALPGGFVYITRGLLERLESEAEFVFALGHEIGHVEHRHSMLQQSRKTLSGIFTAPVTVPVALAASIAPGPGGNVVTGVGRLLTAPSRLILARYSRGHEREADLRGLHFAHEMRFDPRDSEKLFNFFKSEEKKFGGPGRGWLSTHPLTDDRIQEVDDTIRADYPDVVKRPASSFRGSSPRFQAILARLEKHSKAYQHYDVGMGLLFKHEPNEFELAAAKDRLERALKAHPQEPLFHIGVGEEIMTRKEFATARPHFEKALALFEKRMPGESHWKAHFYLGMIDVEGKRPELAVGHLEKALALFPLQPGIHFFLGEAHRLIGHKDKARAAYKKVLELTPSSHPLAKKAKERLGEL